jgi:hypothetical protein
MSEDGNGRRFYIKRVRTVYAVQDRVESAVGGGRRLLAVSRFS